MNPPNLQPEPAVLGAILRGETQPDQEQPDPDRESEQPKEPEQPDRESEQPKEPEQPDREQPDREQPKEPEQPDQEQPDGEEAPRLTIREAAELLGKDPADLYRELTVGLPDERGEVSLEELKAGYVEAARLEDREEALAVERGDYEQQRHKRELEELRNRRELQTIMGFVRNLPPELIQQAQAAHTETLGREVASLFEARPQWRDPEVYDAARERLVGRALEHGFTRAEVQNTPDHRMWLLLDRLDTLERERAEAQETLRKAVEAREASTRQPRSGRRGGKPAASQTRATRARQPGASDQDKAAAVSEVLRRRR